MAKSDAKQETPIDVLVLGEHPAGYLAAALLRQQQPKAKPRVLHATIPGEEPDDRLVSINPAFFDLHPLLGNLRRKLKFSAVYGLQFLADDAQTRSEYRSKAPIVYVTHYRSVRDQLAKIAAAEGVECVEPKIAQVH